MWLLSNFMLIQKLYQYYCFFFIIQTYSFLLQFNYTFFSKFYFIGCPPLQSFTCTFIKEKHILHCITFPQYPFQRKQVSIIVLNSIPKYHHQEHPAQKSFPHKDFKLLSYKGRKQLLPMPCKQCASLSATLLHIKALTLKNIKQMYKDSTNT